MNEELLERLRLEVVKAKRLNPKHTQEELEEYVREESQGAASLRDLFPTNVSPRNLGRSAVQGATFNFGDEVLGWLGAKDAQAEMRLREELFRADHPAADAIAAIGGGLVASGGAAAGRRAATGVPRAANSVLRGMKAGTAAGAASGAGAGTDARSRTRGAVTGGAAGAALGAAIPAVANVARYAVSAPNRAARAADTEIRRAGGNRALFNRVQQFISGGRGKEVVLGDLSEGLTAQTDVAANNSDVARAEIGRVMGERQREAPQRILRDVRSTTGMPAGRKTRVRELTTDRDTWANKAYADLRTTPIDFRLDEVSMYLRDNPNVQAAWQQARLGDDIADGSWMNKMYGTLTGTNRPSRPVSFNDLHQFHRRLQGQADKAYRAGDGELGGAYKAVRDAVGAALDDASPSWKAVSKEYATRTQAIRAVNDGFKVWQTADVDDLKDVVSTLQRRNPAALDEFRRGIAAGLTARLRSTRENRNIAGELAEGSESTKEKLRIAFGSEANFNEFSRRVDLEARMSRTGKTAMGGSSTNRRQMASSGPESASDVAGAGAIAAAAGAPIGAPIAAAAMGGVRRGMTRGQNKHLAPILMTQGAEEIQRLLGTWNRNPNLKLSDLWTTTAPAVAGLLSGR